MAHEYGKETLSKEFKSDIKGLPDSELVEAVVALANTDGGHVYLGVEDDGTPTGAQRKHQDPIGLAARWGSGVARMSLVGVGCFFHQCLGANPSGVVSANISS